MEKYCAVIADVVNSREMDTLYRNEVQQTLIQKIKELNELYNNQLAAYIDISCGDQIQALFYKCEDAYSFICIFRAEMYPVQFRIGIGVGNWNVRILNESLEQKASSNLQDGTAYHFARNAIEKTERDSHSRIIFYSGNEMDAFINVYIANEDRIFQNQSDTQKQLSLVYNKIYPINPILTTDETCIPIISCMDGTQSKIAEYMKTTPQNISQNIRRGMIIYQRELQAAINLLMRTRI